MKKYDIIYLFWKFVEKATIVELKKVAKAADMTAKRLSQSEESVI